MTTMDLILDGRVLGLLILAVCGAGACYLWFAGKDERLRDELEEEMRRAPIVRRPEGPVNLSAYLDRRRKLEDDGLVVNEYEVTRTAPASRQVH